MGALEQTDPEMVKLIRQEQRYQLETLRLIPSENYTSAAVMEAQGSVLTNKYSEGYPGKRYYEGQRYIDKLETVVQERAKALFHMEHANVQPYSGSPANMAVYYALLEPGDTIMGMALPHGGHLTHGWNVSFSARFYRAVQYSVDPKTHLIDYDQLRDLARSEGPKIIVAGATAYPRQFDFQAFGDIAREVGAYFMADISHIAGLVVAGANRTHGRRPRHALRKHCRRVGRRARHEAHFGRGACADLDDCLRVESTRRVRGELVPTPSRPTTADCGLQLTPATQHCVSPSVKQAKVRPQDNLRCGKPASGEPAVSAV